VENTSSQFLLDLNTRLVNSIKRISSKTQVIPAQYLVVQDYCITRIIHERENVCEFLFFSDSRENVREW